MRFVLDASVSSVWMVGGAENQTAYAKEVLALIRTGDRPVVPWLWHVETAAVLRRQRAVKVGRLSVRAYEAAFRFLENLPLNTCHIDLQAEEIAALAKEFTLTAYDSIYVGLARQLGLPLATLDGGMASAAKRAGVKLA
jgi:predicted nucleic acid-binding protein